MTLESIAEQVERALAGTGPIPRETVVQWIEWTHDLRTLATLYRLTDEGYYRIQPELGQETTCGLVCRYLLECIRENVVADETITERWEAAQILHGWFCKLSEMTDTVGVLRSAAAAVTDHFLTGTEDERNAIEAGFLEHALEMTALRPYFQHWRDDERLRPAWERALAWGEAHPGFTWDLLKQVQRMSEK